MYMLGYRAKSGHLDTFAVRVRAALDESEIDIRQVVAPAHLPLLTPFEAGDKPLTKLEEQLQELRHCGKVAPFWGNAAPPAGFPGGDIYVPVLGVDEVLVQMGRELEIIGFTDPNQGLRCPHIVVATCVRDKDAAAAHRAIVRRVRPPENLLFDRLVLFQRDDERMAWREASVVRLN